MCITCSSHVHHMFVTCSSHVHPSRLFSVCSSSDYSHHMCITCSSHVHPSRLFSVCSSSDYSHHMCITCSSHVHPSRLFSVCSSSDYNYNTSCQNSIATLYGVFPPSQKSCMKPCMCAYVHQFPVTTCASRLFSVCSSSDYSHHMCITCSSHVYHMCI